MNYFVVDGILCCVVSVRQTIQVPFHDTFILFTRNNFPRRAQLKICFETLKNEIPTLEDKRTSNLNILKSALRYIQVSAY